MSVNVTLQSFTQAKVSFKVFISKIIFLSHSVTMYLTIR